VKGIKENELELDKESPLNCLLIATVMGLRNTVMKDLMQSMVLTYLPAQFGESLLNKIKGWGVSSHVVGKEYFVFNHMEQRLLVELHSFDTMVKLQSMLCVLSDVLRFKRLMLQFIAKQELTVETLFSMVRDIALFEVHRICDDVMDLSETLKVSSILTILLLLIEPELSLYNHGGEKLRYSYSAAGFNDDVAKMLDGIANANNDKALEYCWEATMNAYVFTVNYYSKVDVSTLLPLELSREVFKDVSWLILDQESVAGVAWMEMLKKITRYEVDVLEDSIEVYITSPDETSEYKLHITEYSYGPNVYTRIQIEIDEDREDAHIFLNRTKGEVLSVNAMYVLRTEEDCVVPMMSCKLNYWVLHHFAEVLSQLGPYKGDDVSDLHKYLGNPFEIEEVSNE
jgi:hypothetical protein